MQLVAKFKQGFFALKQEGRRKPNPVGLLQSDIGEVSDLRQEKFC